MINDIVTNYGLYIIIVETIAIITLLLLRLWDYSDMVKLSLHKKKECTNQVELPESRCTRKPDKGESELRQQKARPIQDEHPLEKQKQSTSVNEAVFTSENKQQDNATLIHYQYLKEANGGKFMKLIPSPEKCNFRTWVENGVRKYEFCGNVAKALANINAIFDDVCDIESKHSDATDIENVSTGTLDSELKIINKAKIRLK